MSDESTQLEDFLAGFAKKPTMQEEYDQWLQQKYPGLFPNWKK